ncbi:MAG: phosphate ABC transporter substrate-binding protein [Polyangiales bacterium]
MKCVIMALVALLALASCKRPVAETILVAGSTTMQGYLQPVVEEFHKDNPNVDVVIESGGASAGVIALKRLAIDVAMLTRDVTSAEDDLELRNYLVARDGIAIFVHPSNPVRNLTMAQLAHIYSGATTNWNTLGGNDAPIVALLREPEARAQKSLRDMVLGGDEPAKSKHVTGSQGMMDAVKGDPNAIGFISSHHVTPEMKLITVNGVEMSRHTVVSGRYPLARSFYIAVFGPAPPPAAERFVEYVLSKKGQAALEKEGLIVVF